MVINSHLSFRKYSGYNHIFKSSIFFNFGNHYYSLIHFFTYKLNCLKGYSSKFHSIDNFLELKVFRTFKCRKFKSF